MNYNDLRKTLMLIEKISLNINNYNQMEKLNSVVKSPIAPRNTNAVWVNPEDDTIKHFDHKRGWTSVGGDVKLVTLTKSEYEVLVDTGTTDPKTLYIISDVA